jgi:uncharacterized protein
MAKLFWLLLAGLALWYFLLRPRRPPVQRPQAAAGENMVRCAQCGLNLPRSESLVADAYHYCCEEHRTLGPGRPRSGQQR